MVITRAQILHSVQGSPLDRRGDGWQAIKHRYYTVFRDHLLIGGGTSGKQ